MKNSELSPLFEILWNASDNPLLLVADKAVVMANEAAIELTGLSAEDIVGKMLEDILILKGSWKKSFEAEVEGQVRTASGDELDVQIRSWKTQHDDREVSCVQVSISAYSWPYDEKGVSESEETFRSIVEGSNDYIAIVNKEREFLYVNRLIWGLKMEDVIGTKLDRLIPEEFLEAATGAIAHVFESGESFDYETVALDERGAQTWFYSKVSPMKNKDGVYAASIISRDVTEYHNHQLEIERLNEDLEFRVAKQTLELSSLLISATDLSTGLEAGPIFSSVVMTITEALPQISQAVVWLHDESTNLLTRMTVSTEIKGKAGVHSTHGELESFLKNFGSVYQDDIYYPSQFDLSWAFADVSQADKVVACIQISENSFGSSLLFLRGQDDSGVFSLSTVHFLKSLAAQAATALNNVDLYEQLRQLSIRLLHIQEQERRTLAIELHDQLGGLITSLRMVLQEIEPTNETVRAVELLELLGNSARDLSSTLRPSTLDDFGLVAAVSELIPHSQANAALKISFDYNLGEEERFSPSVETVVYRVIQEATTNVLRHSKAEKLEISLVKSENGVDIKIHDNGIGFDTESESTRKSTSLGLRGMEERVALIGGTFSIESSPDSGTIITASIPTDVEAWQ